MRKKVKNSQDGMVAIVVTLMLMLVMSLIVISFANITRREQRQSLDRQLNTQAFYAAETGINDAVAVLREADTQAEVDAITKTTCDLDPAHPLNDNKYDPSLGAEVGYSCLLIDPTPTVVQYGNINSGESKSFPVMHSTGNVETVVLYWQTSENDNLSGYSSCPAVSAGTFPSAWPSTSCASGPLRIEIVPVPSAGFDRSSLALGTKTVVAMPSGNTLLSGEVANTTFQTGAIVEAPCNTTVTGDDQRHCKVAITGLSTDRYYIRVSPLYRAAAVSACSVNTGVTNCASSNRREIIGAQARIDSTGRANDIVRRVQAHVDIQPGASQDDAPSFAIESNESLCKRFSILPPSTIVDGSGSCAVEFSTPVAPPVGGQDFYWSASGNGFSSCIDDPPAVGDGFDGCVTTTSNVYARRGVRVTYDATSGLTGNMTTAGGSANLYLLYRQFPDANTVPPLSYGSYQLGVFIGGTSVTTINVPAVRDHAYHLFNTTLNIPADNPGTIELRWLNDANDSTGDADLQIGRVMMCRNTCNPVLTLPSATSNVHIRSMGLCLDAVAGIPTQRFVYVNACNNNDTGQRWNIVGSRFQPVSGGLEPCYVVFTLVSSGNPAPNNQSRLNTCSPSLTPWSFENSALQFASVRAPNHCLDVRTAAGSMPSTGWPVYAEFCGGGTDQDWTIVVPD